MTLISVGYNSKLGPGVGSFSIPDGKTCPGKSDYCVSICYAKKGFFRFPQNAQKYESNLVALVDPSFVERMVAEIRAANVQDFRIHVSGDFSSPMAVQKWIRIAERLPSVRFWAYTRSWRIGGDMLRWLEKLRALPNVALYASTDESIADKPPRGWLIANVSDIVQVGVDMPLCPNQMTGGKVTCSSCRICIEGRSDISFIPH